MSEKNKDTRCICPNPDDDCWSPRCHIHGSDVHRKPSTPAAGTEECDATPEQLAEVAHVPDERLRVELAVVTSEVESAHRLFDEFEGLSNDGATSMATLTERLVTLQERLTELQARNKRDGNWLDKDGACKVCDGEIPYGHTNACDIWKLEAKLREAKNLLKDIHGRMSPTAFPSTYKRIGDFLAANA